MPNNQQRIAVCAGIALLAAVIAASIHFAAERIPATDKRTPVTSTGGEPPSSVTAVQRDDAGDTRRTEERSRNDVSMREVSQTFRHSTFLFEIRRAGFYCDDVVSSYEIEEKVWLASCMDGRGYKMSVSERQEFRVEPILHQVDSAF